MEGEMARKIETLTKKMIFTSLVVVLIIIVLIVLADPIGSLIARMFIWLDSMP